MSHITGGGIAANIARVLPQHLAADIDRSSWTPQPVFTLIGRLGKVEQIELERTFNMGMGMIAIVPASAADAALRVLQERGVPSWVCGAIRDRREGEHGDAEAKGGKGGATSLMGAYAI